MVEAPPPASTESACNELAAAAKHLLVVSADIEHDLWSGDVFNVAPTRIDEARQLHAKGVASWTDRDLDYVMFKSMTTMGGEPTFKFVLPRFLAAASRHPDYGWTSQSHVLKSKLEMIDAASLAPDEARAMSGALTAYARLEWAFAREADGSAEMPEEAAQLAAAANALARHSA